MPPNHSNNDPKQYRNRIMTATTMDGWNTVEKGISIPAMPTYPPPLPPHKNIKLPLDQKLNKAISIYKEKRFNNARQYIINTKIPEEYGTHAVRGKEGVVTQEKYTPEWILAKEITTRPRGGRTRTVRNTQRKRKALRKTLRKHKTRRNRKQ
jgi:hypothetical protein